MVVVVIAAKLTAGDTDGGIGDCREVPKIVMTVMVIATDSIAVRTGAE